MFPSAGSVEDFVETILTSYGEEEKLAGGTQLDVESMSLKAEQLASEISQTIEVDSGAAPDETQPASAGDVEAPIICT